MKYYQIVLFVLLISFTRAIIVKKQDSMPLPFTRELSLNMQGKDVFMAQEFIKRWNKLSQTLVNMMAPSIFDIFTQEAISQFQKSNQLSTTGTLNFQTASLLLQQFSYDGYKDSKTVEEMQQYNAKYKVWIPVSRNRSIETTGYLYDSKMNLLLNFTARLHGQQEFNEFTSNGNTPTGLHLFDLNSPEDDPKSFGPYPVNRSVVGVKGNAKMLVPNIRSGILLHTGEWDDWHPPMPMPNSHGCIHAYPDAIKTIWQVLVNKLGVTVNPNTDGKYPYPYIPQGLLSIEQID